MRPWLALSLLVLLAGPSTARASAPRGWVVRGADSTSYTAVLDSVVTRHGRRSARFESIAPPNGFGTMMQTVGADRYLGQRLRLSAWVRTRDLTQHAALWMRVDGKEPGKMLAFDNMFGRPITGTREWAQYSVVLDVSKEASQVAFGVLMAGEGVVWIDDLRVERVSERVPTTEDMGRPPKPVNLDFEK